MVNFALPLFALGISKMSARMILSSKNGKKFRKSQKNVGENRDTARICRESGLLQTGCICNMTLRRQILQSAGAEYLERRSGLKASGQRLALRAASSHAGQLCVAVGLA